RGADTMAALQRIGDAGSVDLFEWHSEVRYCRAGFSRRPTEGLLTVAEATAETITAAEFWQQLQSLECRQARLVMPVGALVRSVPIVSIQGHYPVVELSTPSGEVLTFTVSDAAEIKRIQNLQGGRSITRYDVTLPLGDYFAFISE